MPVKLPILGLERLVMFRKDLQIDLLIEAYLRINMENMEMLQSAAAEVHYTHYQKMTKLDSTRQSSVHL